MIRRLRERALPVRILAYAAAAASVFAVSAGLGAMGALMLSGDLTRPETEEPRALQSTDEPRRSGEVATPEADRIRQRTVASSTAARQDGAGYVEAVGGIQAEAVETFLDSHDRLLRYDALTAEDIEKMRDNQDLLQESTDRVGGLDPPENYEEHHEVFRSAVGELHEAARQAYVLAADPTGATRSGFDAYDGHVGAAADRLRRSNEVLGRKFETIEGVREVSPL
jgi:hypothetical protein